jgi:hypothetical protein
MNVWTRKALFGAAVLAVAGAAPALRAADDSDVEALRSTLGGLTQQFNDLKTWVDAMPKFELNTDMRYDYQRYGSGTLGSGGKVFAIKDPANDGVTGLYAKRTEVKLRGAAMPWLFYDVQYDFSAMKLEDVGVEMLGLSFVPGMETTGWTFDAKLGQFRQPFGIEAQTGSSASFFPERSMLNGGANPVVAKASTQIVKERVMGLHLKHSHDFGGMFGWTVQATVANDIENATGLVDTSSVAGWSAAQAKDQDPSEFGRLGLDSSKSLPMGSKLSIGASAIHDSRNTAPWAGSGSAVGYADTFGGDAMLEMADWKLQGEFASRASYGAGSFGRQEAWYLVSDLEPLKVWNADAPKVELLTRYEGDTADVDHVASNTDILAGSKNKPAINAVSLGLRYYWIGKNYTSLNYTVYGINNDFSAAGGTEFWQVQQQFFY